MIYVGEILLIGLSARSSASVMLHWSAEPAVVAREGLISVQHYKESFAFKSKGPGSGLLRFFIPSLDISFVCGLLESPGLLKYFALFFVSHYVPCICSFAEEKVSHSGPGVVVRKMAR